jgi:hypothetical protein
MLANWRTDYFSTPHICSSFPRAKTDAPAMLVHMVWFKWRADATEEQIASAIAALVALKDKIPCILELSVGKNVTTRTPHTHGLLVKFASIDDLPVYSDHPEHQAVVKGHILPIKEEILALDYNTE